MADVAQIRDDPPGVEKFITINSPSGGFPAYGEPHGLYYMAGAFIVGGQDQPNTIRVSMATTAVEYAVSGVNLDLIVTKTLSSFMGVPGASASATGLPGFIIKVESLPELPEDIKAQLNILHDISGDEDSLYAIADDIATWVPEGIQGYQNVLGTHLVGLPPLGARILLSALADAEVKLTSTKILEAIRQFLHAQDKRLAQAAAGCLIICGGTVGKLLLQDVLRNNTTIPHIQLLQGMLELLS